MAGEKFINIMQKVAKPVASETSDLMFGEVIKISPLKIRIDNRFEVDEKFLILSALVKKTTIKIPEREDNTHTHTVAVHSTSSGGTTPHTHEIPQMSTQAALPDILLWRGLEVGDTVRILRVNKGQMFYVLEREEGID